MSNLKYLSIKSKMQFVMLYLFGLLGANVIGVNMVNVLWAEPSSRPSPNKSISKLQPSPNPLPLSSTPSAPYSTSSEQPNLSPLSKINNAKNVDILADELIYNAAAQTADAKGNVKLTYKVQQKLVTAIANEAHVKFDKDGKIKEATLDGNVQLEQEATTTTQTHDQKIDQELTITADNCVYEFEKKQAICSGKTVIVKKGNDYAKGSNLKWDLSDGSYTLKSIENQVSGVLMS